jgi:sugar phosphate isomerase/epimerase
MKLAVNTFVYEVAKKSIEDTIKSAEKFGFRYMDYAAYRLGNPDTFSKDKRSDMVKRFKDAGLYCSQMLLVHTENISSPDKKKRQDTLDYMKRVTDFQLELGGRQVLICWGCGVLESGVIPENQWVNMVNVVHEYANWCFDKNILIDLEMDPHVYFLVNSTTKLARAVEDIGMPNVYPNVDIGHLCITREAPHLLEKLAPRIIHVHISETDTFEHTNSIIGTGNADFRAYIDKVIELGIEENCRKLDEPCVAGIEMGEPGGEVDDPDRWVAESIEYLKNVLPEVTL